MQHQQCCHSTLEILPEVWIGYAFPKCHEDILIGVGRNIVTLLLVFYSILKFRREVRMDSNSKMIFAASSLGTFLSFLNLSKMLISLHYGGHFGYYEWLYECSQTITWVIVLITIKFLGCFTLMKNWSLCIWWLFRPFLVLPRLLSFCSPPQKWLCVISSLSFFVDVAFGIGIFLFRVMHYPTMSDKRESSLGDALIQDNTEDDSKAISTSTGIINFWRNLTFGWVTPMMDTGLTKQLDFNDLIELPPQLHPSSCHNALSSCWINEQNKALAEPSLFRAVCVANGRPFLWIGILKIINDGLGFTGPLLLNSFIHFLEQGNGSMYGYCCAVGLGLVSILRAFLGSQYTFYLSKLRLQLRAAITTCVYQKCLNISLAERSGFSSGEIQTLMSVDAERVVNLFASFHDIWSLPVQIGIALFLLYTQVNIAFLAGVFFIILLIPVNRWIAAKISLANQLMMKQKDERIRKIGELLMDIRTLKMYCWESIFANRLMETREHEVKHLATRKYLDAWCVYFWATTPSLFSLSTFGVYVLMGFTLDAATVFTSLSLFNMLISPLNSFPWVINGLVEAFTSLQRLERFLSCVEIGFDKLNKDMPESSEASCCSAELSKGRKDGDENMAIFIINADSAWCSIKEHPKPTLKGIYVSIPKGWITVIHGEVGAGKSSLLNTILGEMRLVKGKCFLHGSIAYVPQEPWIQSGTLRDNILFGKEYNEERYVKVVTACALDIDIASMSGGDLAIIGERGFNLSGGQKARVALARAVYQDCDIYLLDDILSAVDAHVSTWLLTNVIQGPLMEGKTRILCTHSEQAVQIAEMVIILERGFIKWAGHSDEIHTSILHKVKEKTLQSFNLKRKDSETLESKLEMEVYSVADNHGDTNLSSNSESAKFIEDETRKEGRVEFWVYRKYAAFAGWATVTIVLLSTLLMQASKNGNDLWLSHWVDAISDNRYTNNYTFYLVIFATVAGLNSLFTLVRAFSFAFGGLRAAISVHNSLLKNIISAPISFFERNPRGRLLNRFSSDQYAIDDSLPFILNILLANLFNLSGITMVLCLVQWSFFLLLVPLGYIYRNLQVYYRATSRELRRLDSVSRSPIYTSFTESLDGASTIRAFSREHMFIIKNYQYVERNQQASYSELAASVWLSLRLQLLAASVISFISIVAVLGQQKSLPFATSTAGMAGLALSYAMPVISLLNDLLTSFTETEKEMISIERVEQYMEVVPEEHDTHTIISLDWPKEGMIEFDHVTLRYMPFLPAALNDISFNINSGEKVGIAGRTGAGKSSVLNALFRLTPIADGNIFIDKCNICNIPLKELRSRLTVVPQTPFLFQATLRENLDPLNTNSDSDMWSVLEKCHIKEAVINAGGLDAHVREGGGGFSCGQRQLLCLARALLKCSKIMCLDECTASVDPHTTSLIKDTIDSECKGITVITIAHRISTICNMDRVIIFDQGTIVEEGNPWLLLKDGNSRFSKLAKASNL